MNNLRCIKSFITSIFILVVVSHVQADTFDINHINNDSSSRILFSDAESDKTITNVKASYSPVAEQIIVSFKLSKQSVVSIKLMDALGNEVLTLSNGTLEEGMNNLSFETEGKVSSGFYFLRVMSGLETVVKRISVR